MPARSFTQDFAVDAADIDELGHVNNVVYLRYAQDIATAHWRAQASAEMIASYVWVVRRHEVDYFYPLQLGDAVHVRTHVADAAQGAVWVRYVDVFRTGMEKPAVSITSAWCLMDAATRRIKRVPPDIITRFSDQNSG